MHRANELRYKNMQYNRVGESGLKLPAVSLSSFQSASECERRRQRLRPARSLKIHP